jgi:hypothetical protein
MIEGLWSIYFETAEMYGAGVIVFETGRLFGGDDKYYYVGSYVVSEGRLQASAQVTHFAGEPLSVFGREVNFSLGVIAIASSDSFEAIAYRVDDPRQTMSIRLVKRAELP